MLLCPSFSIYSDDGANEFTDKKFILDVLPEVISFKPDGYFKNVRARIELWDGYDKWSARSVNPQNYTSAFNRFGDDFLNASAFRFRFLYRLYADEEKCMWVTIIVVLGIDPVFQGTAAPSTGTIGSGVYDMRSECESDLMRYFQSFDGAGEAKLSFTKNEWGNYRITKEHSEKVFREVRYCMEIHPRQ